MVLLEYNQNIINFFLILKNEKYIRVFVCLSEAAG